MRRSAPLLALVLAMAGCAALEGEGEESLVITNDAGQPLTAVITITQRTGDFVVFSESLFFDPGQARDYPLVMRPDEHVVAVTTSTSVQESIVITIPKKGDTTIGITFFRGGARITTTSS